MHLRYECKSHRHVLTLLCFAMAEWSMGVLYGSDGGLHGDPEADPCGMTTRKGKAEGKGKGNCKRNVSVLEGWFAGVICKEEEGVGAAACGTD
jgi:hypothetical protein